MALIWFLSSQPDLTTGLGLADLIGRKIIHALSFALLALLWWRALREPLSGAAIPAAAAISLCYAAVDEYHQTFVAGRIGSPVDVAIDAVGVAGVVLCLLRRRDRSEGRPATASRAR